MRKKSRRIRFLSGIIIILLWGGLEPVLLCDAAFPFHISCPAPDGKGLVGHVISVTETTAKVQTIIDTASSVSCSMSTTKDSIVCKGTLDEKSALKAMYIPTESNIIQGDSIETSGLGGIYPKGIHIGTVKKVTNTQNITDRYAIVEAAVDFDKLDTVLVIKNQ